MEAGDVATIERLLRVEPVLTRSRGDDGLTPVMLAAYRKRDDVLSLLLAHATELDIFESAAVGRPERVQELIGHDQAIANAYSSDGFTALHLASFFGHAPAVRILLDAGADVNAGARNPMRVHPLHSALAASHYEIAGLLLSRGADPNAPQQQGWTPLHQAGQHGDRALVDLLLAAGADAAAVNDAGASPADTAAEAGHTALARLLRAQYEP
jgi:ankyrin repeat protein